MANIKLPPRSPRSFLSIMSVDKIIEKEKVRRMPVFERRFLGLPALLSLIGIAFSLWNLWGNPETLCVTEGCSLFQDFTVAGISLWWLGVVGFAVLLGCAATGYGFLGLLLSGMGLVLDGILLLIMLVTAPCFNCLLIALMLALTYATFRAAEHDYRRGPLGLSILLAIWSVLFVVNAGGIVRSSVGPWALEIPASRTATSSRMEAISPASSDDAAVHIYFSPSCTACQGLVAAAGGEHGMGPGQQAAWYPVAEDSRDIIIIADIINRMRTGASLDIAMKAALVAAPDRVSPWNLSSPSMLALQFRLWRNKAHVLETGSARLPFVEFRGAPAILMQGQPTADAQAKARPAPMPSGSTNSVNNAMSHDTPNASLPFLDVGGFCDGTAPEGEPCDPPPSIPLAPPVPPISISSGIGVTP